MANSGWTTQRTSIKNSWFRIEWKQNVPMQFKNSLFNCIISHWFAYIFYPVPVLKLLFSIASSTSSFDGTHTRITVNWCWNQICFLFFLFHSMPYDGLTSSSTMFSRSHKLIPFCHKMIYAYCCFAKWLVRRQKTMCYFSISSSVFIRFSSFNVVLIFATEERRSKKTKKNNKNKKHRKNIHT